MNNIKYGVSRFYNIMGINCYMNSILHILQQIPSFIKLINNFKEINNNNLIFELNNLIINSHNNDDKIIVPNNFKNICGQKNNIWNELNQQDSQEFLSFLIFQIEEEIGKKSIFLSKFKNLEITNNFNKKNILEKIIGFTNYYKYKLNKYSPLKEIFYGFMKNIKICNCCKSKTINYESFINLQLSINSNTNTIYECFDILISKERLDNNNKLNCKFCGLKNNGYSKTLLWELPKILIIHLKRFDLNFNKINNNIIYPIDNLDLSKYLDTNSPFKNKYKYNLLGINLHFGNINNGHYVSIIKNMYNKNWYLYNDENEVQLISNNNLQSEHTYLLFYELIDSN